jgi:23S rRNA (pseudouridine1915-N3)-methyltransferase
MLIRLIAVGNKMPEWVEQGYQEYAKRLPPGYALKLVEIAPEKRTKHSDINRIIERESEKILATIKPTNRMVALVVEGQAWSTPRLATFLQEWQQDGRDVDLVVGGPDGLSAACLQKAHQQWSLSALTLPHPLVRIVVAEQIYRAWSILQNHPYHR